MIRFIILPFFFIHRKIRLDAELEKKVFLVKHNELKLKNGDGIHGSFLSKSRLSILTENSSKVSAFFMVVLHSRSFDVKHDQQCLYNCV